MRYEFLRTARYLTLTVVPLAMLASAGGVFLQRLYRDPAAVVPAMQGQDVVTLLACPVLLLAAAAGRRSARGLLVWIGILGYLVYAFTGAAFAYRFNQFFLLYIALFSLGTAALVAVLAGVDAAGLRQHFDAATPRHPVAIFLAFIALVLCLSEVAQVIGGLSSNTEPELIRRSGGAGNFVYVLDLGLVAPITIWAAWWLVRDHPWGYVLAGSMLIKALTMGMALLVSTWLSVQAGLPLEPGLTLGYGLIAFGALVLSIWYFRHCRT